MNYCICPEAFNGVQAQVSLKVACIESRDWQSVAKTSLQRQYKQVESTYTNIFMLSKG